MFYIFIFYYYSVQRKQDFATRDGISRKVTSTILEIKRKNSSSEVVVSHLISISYTLVSNSFRFLTEENL
jgi:hypothetical protein